ncbi:MAG: hypothetical protein K9L68_07630 [Spirochaetales bacterium]|nr:hypothetical protein [Spirochaetales bacterium]MCF7938452.1 hypothetical protein [Spirochaetales bacterium]
MREYTIQGDATGKRYLRIIGEISSGYEVVIIREMDGYVREHHDIMARHLFDTCLRTGYLTPRETAPDVELRSAVS